MTTFDYPAHLEMMWQRAIAPRSADAPTFVSTFAGGGGSSTGYLMAGYRELLAVEWDDNAVATLRLNYPDLDIYHGDIAKLSVQETLERTGLTVGELDLLDGSPPCQGFSTAGKRQLDDSRNQLFREYVRLLRGLKPKVFVMENVSGMVKGKMKLVFAEVMKELKASGYKVSCRLLNAMYFHVPQSRQRLIFIGVRDDLGIEPSHPKGESIPVSCQVAIGSIVPDKIYPRLDTLSNKRASLLKPGENHPKNFSLVRLSAEKPSPTLTKNVRLNGGSQVLHWDCDRVISISECKVLGSFPLAYNLTGSFLKKWERIGNSVPPLMAEAIGRHVRKEILDRLI